MKLRKIVFFIVLFVFSLAGHSTGTDVSGGIKFYFETLGPSHDELRTLNNQYQEIFDQNFDKIYVSTPWMMISGINSSTINNYYIDKLSNLLKGQMKMVMEGTYYQDKILRKNIEYIYDKVCLKTQVHDRQFRFQSKDQFVLERRASFNFHSHKRLLTKNIKRLQSIDSLSYGKEKITGGLEVNLHYRVPQSFCTKWAIYAKGRMEIQILPEAIVRMEGVALATRRMNRLIANVHRAYKEFLKDFEYVTNHSSDSGPFFYSSHLYNDLKQEKLREIEKRDGRKYQYIRLGVETPERTVREASQWGQWSANRVSKSFSKYVKAIEDLDRDFAHLHPVADREIYNRYLSLREFFRILGGRQLSVRFKIIFNHNLERLKRYRYSSYRFVINNRDKIYSFPIHLPLTKREIQRRLTIFKKEAHKEPTNMKDKVKALRKKLAHDHDFRQGFLEFLQEQGYNGEDYQHLAAELRTRKRVTNFRNRRLLKKVFLKHLQEIDEYLNE